MPRKVIVRPKIEEYFCPSCQSKDLSPSPPTFIEKLTGVFLSFLPYQCLHCHFRFYLVVAHTPYKRRIISLLIAMISAVVCIVVFLLIFQSSAPRIHNLAANPVLPAKGKPVATEVKVPQASETPPPVSAAAVSVEIVDIHFGTYRKFGANWEVTAAGLRITRLSEGPFKQAGLAVGDVVVTLDGAPLITEETLMKRREEILAGSIEAALIDVRRGEALLHYRLRK